MPDISVIICTHNPRPDYLRRVLDALKAQTLPKDQWELLLIDNASDQELARSWDLSWHPHGRHIREDKIGLNFARSRGFEEAEGEVAVFVDDDNVLANGWIEEVFRLFQSNPRLGACGGMTVPVYEQEPPDWLPPLAMNLAVGRPQASTVVRSGGFLWGAGLAVRGEAWANLVNTGFRFLGTDRSGGTLVSSGDAELCHALQIAGWQIWYCERLKLEHLISAERCKWNYFRRLYRGHGASSVFFDAYEAIDPKDLSGVRFRWWWRALSVLKQILRNPFDILALSRFGGEGSRRVLRLDSRIGRFLMLLKSRGLYEEALQRGQKWKNRAKRSTAATQNMSA